MHKFLNIFIWLFIAMLGASAVGGIAINRGESINSLWFITAALCIYAIGYRFYASWIATSVLVVDKTRATPAERLDNGRDFMPTHKWVVFGHHFAAIAGPRWRLNLAICRVRSGYYSARSWADAFRTWSPYFYQAVVMPKALAKWQKMN